MIRPKLGLGAIALCVLVALGAITLVATVTQAEQNSNWVVKGVNVNATLKPTAAAELEKLGVNGPRHLILLFMFGKTKVEILCQELAAIGTLLAGGGSTAEALINKCETYLDGTLSPVCKPAEPIKVTAKDLIVLHGGLPFDRFEPAVGESFGVVKFGKECFFGEEVPITGTLLAKESNGKFETEEKVHLFQQIVLLALNLFFGAHLMTIDGSVNVSLVGGHVGLVWKGKAA